MKKHAEKSIFILSSNIILSFYLFIGCSGSSEIQSSFNDNQIFIDGSHQDWGTSLNYVKDDNIAFGFKNDNDNLFIGIVTSDRNKIMKILSTGFTIWIESGKDKLGIIFPLRTDPGEMRSMRMNQPETENLSELKDRINKFISTQQELQIINKDYLPLYTESADKGPGFIGKMGYNMNQFVYELKIPLTNNDLAERIFSKEIDEVEINFATGEFNRGNMPGNRMRGDVNGMRPPKGGNRGMSNRPKGERMDIKPLEYSFDLILHK